LGGDRTPVRWVVIEPFVRLFNLKALEFSCLKIWGLYGHR
jgi:hypothetical protein